MPLLNETGGQCVHRKCDLLNLKSWTCNRSEPIEVKGSEQLDMWVTGQAKLIYPMTQLFV